RPRVSPLKSSPQLLPSQIRIYSRPRSSVAGLPKLIEQLSLSISVCEVKAQLRSYSVASNRARGTIQYCSRKGFAFRATPQ
ncbi:hypothetical protein Csa_001546, partial [Cucumis sativus]